MYPRRVEQIRLRFIETCAARYNRTSYIEKIQKQRKGRFRIIAIYAAILIYAFTNRTKRDKIIKIRSGEIYEFSG